MYLYEYETEDINRLINSSLKGLVNFPENEVYITKFSEGKFGSVYSVRLSPSSNFEGYLPIAAKCPHIIKFNNHSKMKETFIKVFHELEVANSLRSIPWVSSFYKIYIVKGWPFLCSRLEHGTLLDLIMNPSGWNYVQKIQVLIMIVRALSFAKDKNIFSHQDLKPQNIFIRDLLKTHQLKSKTGIRYVAKVGDFGMANAFKVFKKTVGVGHIKLQSNMAKNFFLYLKR